MYKIFKVVLISNLILATRRKYGLYNETVTATLSQSFIFYRMWYSTFLVLFPLPRC